MYAADFRKDCQLIIVSLLVMEADSFHIEVRQGDYYRTRTDDWDSMLPTDIDEMGVEECVELLHAAKEEIAWLVNEISRLECYISVEKQMQRAGETERSTVLRPLSRKSKKCREEYEQTQRRVPIFPSGDSGWSAYRGRSASMELAG